MIFRRGKEALDGDTLHLWRAPTGAFCGAEVDEGICDPIRSTMRRYVDGGSLCIQCCRAANALPGAKAELARLLEIIL